MSSQQLNETKFWRVKDLDGLELVRHAYDKVGATQRHFNECFELGIVEQGGGKFSYRGELRTVGVNSAFIINPGEVHTNSLLKDQSAIFRMIYIDPALMERTASNILGRSVDVPLFSMAVINEQRIFQLIYTLHRDLESNRATLETETNLLLILSQFVIRYADSPIRPSKITSERRAVSQVRDYLEDNYSDNISLRELSQLTHLSTYYVTRIFCREMGLPPYSYLINIRVSRAKRLLAQGHPITHVALETGFTHQSHLNKHFKRIVGITPGQYQASTRSCKTKKR